jgi:hypothetical protein
MSNYIALKFFSENKRKGILGEKIAQEEYKNNGFKVIPTGIGSDFVVLKSIEGKLHQEYVEVKTGNSRVSKKQRIFMKKIKNRGKKYTVYRISNIFMNNYLKANASGDNILITNHDNNLSESVTKPDCCLRRQV